MVVFIRKDALYGSWRALTSFALQIPRYIALLVKLQRAIRLFKNTSRVDKKSYSIFSYISIF